MVVRRHITKPMGFGGFGALQCMPATAKLRAIEFSAATHAVLWANAATVRPMGLLGDQTG